MHGQLPFRIFIIIACISLALPLIAVAADAQSGGSLTRGSRFTVTITGQPSTLYYVWDAGTFSMSGAPGDQPPVISGGTLNLEKDPPEGPFVIGNHAISGGGTILDDIAPSSGDFSNTNYYATITTDANGEGTIEFRTSSNTATRHFAIKVEDTGGNPGQLQVQANLFSRTTPPTPVITVITTTPATPPPTPSPIPTAIPTEISSLPVTPPASIPEPSASSTTFAPLSPFVVLGAIGAVLAFARKR